MEVSPAHFSLIQVVIRVIFLSFFGSKCSGRKAGCLQFAVFVRELRYPVVLWILATLFRSVAYPLVWMMLAGEVIVFATNDLGNWLSFLGRDPLPRPFVVLGFLFGLGVRRLCSSKWSELRWWCLLQTIDLGTEGNYLFLFLGEGFPLFPEEEGLVLVLAGFHEGLDREVASVLPSVKLSIGKLAELRIRDDFVPLENVLQVVMRSFASSR